MSKKIEWFLQSNSTWARLGRTILQGIIGVLISNVDLLFSTVAINPAYKTLIVALIMCILSPIMKELGGHDAVT